MLFAADALEAPAQEAGAEVPFDALLAAELSGATTTDAAAVAQPTLTPAALAAADDADARVQVEQVPDPIAVLIPQLQVTTGAAQGVDAPPGPGTQPSAGFSEVPAAQVVRLPMVELGDVYAETMQGAGNDDHASTGAAATLSFAAAKAAASAVSAGAVVSAVAGDREVPVVAPGTDGAAQAQPQGAAAVASLTFQRETAAPGPALPAHLDAPVPVANREFSQEVGNRLAWMANHRIQVAELKLDPPQLRPLEMRLSISNDQASLSLVSVHAAVRDALQASLPRLHDMLQGLGINLGSVSVGAQTSGGHWAGGEYRGPPSEPGGRGVVDIAAAAPLDSLLIPTRTGIGVVDTYA